MPLSPDSDKVLSPRVEHVTILEHLSTLLHERDRAQRETVRAVEALVRALGDLTDTRFTALSKQLEAQAAQVAVALASSGEAIAKAEDSTRRQISDLDKRLSGSIHDLDELTGAKFVTFRTLVDGQATQVALALASSKEAITKAEAATKEAINKAENATDKRFDSVNEFRAQQRDIIAQFVRTDFMAQALEARDATLAALSGRIRELELVTHQSAAQQAGAQGKVSDQRASLAAYIGLATLVITIIIIVANVLTSTAGK